jgi:hypothetical protein
MTVLFRDLRFYGFCMCNPCPKYLMLICASRRHLAIRNGAGDFRLLCVHIPTQSASYVAIQLKGRQLSVDHLDDYSIFSLIPPSWTIFILTILCVIRLGANVSHSYGCISALACSPQPRVQMPFSCLFQTSFGSVSLSSLKQSVDN